MHLLLIIIGCMTYVHVKEASHARRNICWAQKQQNPEIWYLPSLCDGKRRDRKFSPFSTSLKFTQLKIKVIIWTDNRWESDDFNEIGKPNKSETDELEKKKKKKKMPQAFPWNPRNSKREYTVEALLQSHMGVSLLYLPIFFLAKLAKQVC